MLLLHLASTFPMLSLPPPHCTSRFLPPFLVSRIFIGNSYPSIYLMFFIYICGLFLLNPYHYDVCGERAHKNPLYYCHPVSKGKNNFRTASKQVVRVQSWIETLWNWTLVLESITTIPPSSPLHPCTEWGQIMGSIGVNKPAGNR